MADWSRDEVRRVRKALKEGYELSQTEAFVHQQRARKSLTIMANQLGIPYKTLWDLIQEGRVRAHFYERVGGVKKYYFTDQDEEWLQRNLGSVWHAQAVKRGEDLSSEEMEDYESFIEGNMTVRREDGALVPFVLRGAQRRYCRMRKRLRKERGQVRVVEVKPRQYGSSSVKGACAAVDMLRYPGSRLIVMGDTLKVAMHIAEQYVWRPLWEMRKRIGTQMSEFKGKTTGTCFHVGESCCVVETANRMEKVGRSVTAHLGLFSEAAYWWRTMKDREHADEVLASVLSSFPDPHVAEQVAIDVESTAFGIGGTFYDTYQWGKEGKLGWNAHFVAWYEIEKYRLPTEPELEALFDEFKQTSDVKIADRLGITDEEAEYVNTCSGITLGNLLWRREYGLPKAQGDSAKFRRDYPANDIEAFQTSGSPVFDVSAVNDAQRVAVENPGTPYLVLPDGTNQAHGGQFPGYKRERYVGLNPCYLEFREAKPKEQFVIGCDVALGVGGVHGDNQRAVSHNSLSVASVWSLDYRDQVAEWWGRPLPEEFGDAVFELAILWGMAWVNIEQNAHGYSAMQRLLKRRYPYLFLHQVMSTDGRSVSYSIGTSTNNTTKEPLLDAFRLAVKRKEAIPRSSKLLSQMEAFQYIDGKPQKRNADFIMAALHAWTPINQGVQPSFAGEEHFSTVAGMGDDLSGRVPMGAMPMGPGSSMRSVRAWDPEAPLMSQIRIPGVSSSTWDADDGIPW